MHIDDRWKKKIYKDVLEINSFDEFIKFINCNEDTLKGALYRGQRKPDWDLKPSFFRKISDSKDAKNIYNQQLEQFKLHTRGRHSIPYDSPFDDDLIWWALGQHYGLATPLLDWVRSPYTAAFFSFTQFEHEQDKRAIFIFDYKKFEEIKDKKRGSQSTYIERVSTLTHDNARLVSQQGELIYLSPIDQIKYQTIESALNKYKEDNNLDELLLLKILIPENERDKILSRLDQMNINHSTLFPDLGGAAEYCNYLVTR